MTNENTYVKIIKKEKGEQMEKETIVSSVGHIAQDTQNPFDKILETAHGRTIDTIDVYGTEEKSEQSIPELNFCVPALIAGGKDGAEAIRILEEYAKKDFTEAQYLLGQFYHLHKKDDEKAILWHTKSAKNGNTRSQICLSYLLIEKRKYAEAIEYLKMANTNEASVAEVSYIMSHLYADGNGVKQDKEKSLALLKQSATQKNTCALYELGYYYVEKQEFGKALECYKNSAELGDSCGAYNYAVCYINGEGVEIDKQKALEIIDNFVDNYGETKILTDLKGKIQSNEKLKNQSQLNTSSLTPVANRAYLTPLKIWPSILGGLLCCVMMLLFLGLAIFYSKISIFYVIIVCFFVLSVIYFVSIPGIKKENMQNEKVKNLPRDAILFTDDAFVILTDKMNVIKFSEINKINYKRNRYRLEYAIGTIIIETNSGACKVDNINNILFVHATMNQILTKHMPKSS